MPKTKAEFRKEIFIKTQSLNLKIWQEKSQKLLNNLKSIKSFQEANNIFTFLPKFPEPNLIPLLNSKLKQKTNIAAWDGKNIVQIKNLDFKPGKYQIPIPKIKTKDFNIKKIEVALIPGMAFDKNLNRLGHGKGFFDRFLQDKKFLKIGLCFDFQIYPKIPTEKHDQKLDLLITESLILES